MQCGFTASFHMHCCTIYMCRLLLHTKQNTLEYSPCVRGFPRDTCQEHFHRATLNLWELCYSAYYNGFTHCSVVICSTLYYINTNRNYHIKHISSLWLTTKHCISKAQHNTARIHWQVVNTKKGHGLPNIWYSLAQTSANVPTKTFSAYHDMQWSLNEVK